MKSIQEQGGLYHVPVYQALKRVTCGHVFWAVLLYQLATAGWIENALNFAIALIFSAFEWLV